MPSHQIAAYYYPGFHTDPRCLKTSKAWTEWELAKTARPRFPGHRQPRIPLWGYQDESDPAVMGLKADTAAKHGVGTFLFDWYWYQGRPFLQDALEKGLLGRDSIPIKFALMWANHDWKNVFPRPAGRPFEIIESGRVSVSDFIQLTDYAIEKYFRHPAYWHIDGCPYFSIYDFPTLLAGFGNSLELVAELLRDFRKRTRAAGFRDLHLNLVYWQRNIFAGANTLPYTPDQVAAMGVDSVTSYVWIHHVRMTAFPQMSYDEAFEEMRNYTSRTSVEFARYGIPYFPNVTVGWDVSPRCEAGGQWLDWEYPYMAGYTECPASRFREVLRWAKEQKSAHPVSRGVITLNSWNEWTEGSYLEPDTTNGFTYLEAVREIFS